MAVSCNLSGNFTTSAEMTSGTTAPLPSTPVAVSGVSAPVRYSDQFNGRRGLPHLNRWFDGDTEYSTWAEDGQQYGMCEDCAGVIGVNGGTFNNIGWVGWDVFHMNATPIGGAQKWSNSDGYADFMR